MIKVYKNLCELIGVAKNNFYEQDLAYITIQASEWKKTCGVKGRKREEQKLNAQKFVREQFGIEASEDACDAVCQGYHVITKILK